MAVVLETNVKEKVDVYYVRSPIPSVVEESIAEYFHDHDAFTVAEIIQDQESVYQSLQMYYPSDKPSTSSSADARSNCDHGQNRGEGNSSVIASQLEIDEAFARQLQEMDYQFSDSSLSENTGTNADAHNTESPRIIVEGSTSNTSSQVARQDRVDPDSMTYEELQSLGEAVGTECTGLSDELISYLPSSTYKTGLFSKREKDQECVICYMAYKNKEKLIKLPCQHQFHKTCVTKWLKIKKVCPVCMGEVFGS